MPDATLNVRSGLLSSQSMRYHELYLSRWFSTWAYVREGYPVPTVFGAPMDAFGHFQQLWSGADNPFSYLLELKDAKGTPLYLPHPAPVRYPLISVFRKGWKYRTSQNFSIHRWARINWPTVSDDVSKCDLGNVTTSRMPMAFDYRFQIDHFCSRPDSQAFFIDAFFYEMWRTGGALQTWIPIEYPGWGTQLVRMYLDGDIDSTTPEEPADGSQVEYRTTINLVVEGFMVDLKFKILPALWTLITGYGGVDPRRLSEDLRARPNNVTLDSRDNVPDGTECARAKLNLGEPEVFEVDPETIAPVTVFGVPAITLIPVTFGTLNSTLSALTLSGAGTVVEGGN